MFNKSSAEGFTQEEIDGFNLRLDDCESPEEYREVYSMIESEIDRKHDEIYPNNSVLSHEVDRS